MDCSARANADVRAPHRSRRSARWKYLIGLWRKIFYASECCGEAGETATTRVPELVPMVTLRLTPSHALAAIAVGKDYLLYQ
jgi:hypothetical protein